MRRKLVTEIGFDSNASSLFTVWTDVSADVASVDVDRGRSKELDTIEAGECTLVLDNEDGRYTAGRSTSPYVGKIKVRKPVRVYTALDDNLVHFECVIPANYDLDKARFYLTGTSTITQVADAGVTAPLVWEHNPQATAADTFAYAGGNSDSDQITVKAGQQITVSAQACVTATGASAGVGVVFFTRADLGTVSAFSAFAPTSSTTWSNIDYTYTAPADGAVRLVLYSRRNSGAGNARYVNLKMSFPSTDVGYSKYTTTAASGMYPEFRGFVDTWSVSTDGFTGTTTIKAVDWLGLASRPIDTYTREYIKAAYAGAKSSGITGEFIYWPLSQGTTDTQAAPLVGGYTYPLTIKYDPAFPPATSAFNDVAVFTPQDGASGGYSVDDDNWAKGAALTLVSRGVPVIKQDDAFGTAFWIIPKWPSAGRSCLFTSASSGGGRYTSLFLNADGTLTAEWFGDGQVADLVVNTTWTIPNGKSTHIIYKVYKKADGLTYAALWKNNVGPSEQPSTNNVRYTPSYVTWGGRYFPGVSSADYFHGTLSHIMYASGGMLDYMTNQHWLAGNPNLSYTETSLTDQILTFAGFPQYRRLDAGLSKVQPPSWESGADVSGLLADTSGDGGAVFFIGPEGAAIVHNRSRRFAANPRWNIAEWSDSLLFSLDSSYVLNQVTAQRVNGVYRTVRDDNSVAEFQLRDKTVRRDVQSDIELGDAAGWVLSRYSESLPRCESLVIDASALNGSSDVDKDLMALAHGGALSDKINLTGLPATAPGDSLTYFIEGISTSIKVDGAKLSYVTTLSVSDAARSAAWTLDDATYGLIDTDGAFLTY